MHLEELDIEAMRAAILKDMHEACKPFLEELQRLEILEQLVVRTKKANGQAKPNGRPRSHQHPRSHQFRGRSQPKSCMEILQKEPGLTTEALVERLQRGGYVFSSSNPAASLATQLRKLVVRGLLRAEVPESRQKGETNRYYPVEAE